LNICSTKEKEAIQKCIIYERENEEMKDIKKDLENEIGSNKREFEAMVRVMEDLEFKINEYQTKEENIDL
jgi:hypothetical protein